MKIKRKIKILNIITGGLLRDGITLSQLDYMKLINKDYFDIDIAAVHNDSELIIEEFNRYGCNVIRLPDRKKRVISYIISLNKIIKKKKYDIIHVHGSSSIMAIELLIAKINGVKVRIAHSRNTETNNYFIHKILKPIFTKSYNVALACGEDAGRWLFENQRFTVLHNGKDLEKYKFDENIRKKIREKYNLHNIKTLATVGNCNDQKNQSFLIDVFNEIYKKDKNIHLFIIGDGKNKKYLEEKCKKLNIGDNVTFLGRIDNVNEYINAMDIMLLPSLYEGLPNVVLEWQASGVPCLVSDKITRECKVSNLVKFISIDLGVKPWVEKILELKISEKNEKIENSKEGCNALINKNFEIKNNVKKLEEIYKKNFEEKNKYEKN